MKGVFELQPPGPRYDDIWDVSIVLKFLATLFPNNKLSLKLLTLKLVMLIALITGQRCQSIHYLDLQGLSKHETYFKFKLLKHVKQSKAGVKINPIFLNKYPIKPELCVYQTLEHYLLATNTLRGEETQLFISYIKPYKKVCKDTVSRWIKLCLSLSGVDVTKFKPHSTRSASSSATLSNGISVQQILKTVGWKSEEVFRKFYAKPILESNNEEYTSSLLNKL